MEQILVHCLTSQPVAWYHWSGCKYDDKVAVFRFKFSTNTVDLAYFKTLLNVDERARAQRYGRYEDQHRFMFTRGVLRIIAGRYLNQHPARIQFDSKINKKPELRNSAGWYVNVTHSGEWALVAISRASIGIDIEKINPNFSFQDILSHSFSVEEQRYVEANPNERQLFYQLWTRKEALVKATAKGIDDDFAHVPALDGFYKIQSSILGTINNWTVVSFDICPDYSAAVACQYTEENLKFYTVDSGDFTIYES